MNDALLSSDKDTWCTPVEIITVVQDMLGGIDVDPCSNNKEAPNVPARIHFTKDDNGLAQEWKGKVYVNPPYGNEIGKWVDKAIAEHNLGHAKEIVLLVAAMPDTQWFRQLDPYAICLLTGRLTFKGAPNPAPFPSAVVYIGSNYKKFKKIFSNFGRVILPDGLVTKKKPEPIVEPTPVPEPINDSDREILKVCSTLETTDLGNSDRFLAWHKHEIRYCHAWKSWLVWNGKIWEKDERGAIYALASRTVRRIHHEADFRDLTAKERNADFYQWCHRSQETSRINGMLTLAQHVVAITPFELNTNPNLLTVENGTIIFNPIQLVPHQQEHLISQMADVSYDPKATAPTWVRHIETVFDKNEGLIKTFQEICGSCLVGKNPDMFFIICHATGKNGKSVTLSVLASIFGDYSRNMNPASLMVQKYESGGEAARPDVIRLLAGRFVMSVESRRGRALSENLIKQLTGQDRITVRDLYGKPIEFIFGGHIFLASNNKPRLKELSKAVRERIVLFPFTHYFQEKDRDPDIIPKLLAERSGILNWCIEGWKRTHENHPPLIKLCKEVQEATEEYFKENDDILPFLEECFVMNKDGGWIHENKELLGSRVRSDYLAWCHTKEVRPMYPHDFADALRDVNARDRHTMNGTVWTGLVSKMDVPPTSATAETYTYYKGGMVVKGREMDIDRLLKEMERATIPAIKEYKSRSEKPGIGNCTHKKCEKPVAFVGPMGTDPLCQEHYNQWICLVEKSRKPSSEL